MKTSYIHDGYTVPGFVEGMPGVYADCRFTFRPALAQDRAVIRDKIVASPARDGESIVAQTIAGRVVDWDVLKTKSLGSDELVAVALTLDEVLRVPQSLTVQIFNRIMGDSSPGEAPGSNGKQHSEAVDADMTAAINGTTPDEVAAKN